MTKKTISSDLGRRAAPPLTGLGSGIPQNQAMAGARDPVAAAAAAASPEAARKAMIEAAAEDERRNERRQRLLDGWREKKIRTTITEEEDMVALLQRSEDDELRQMEDELVESEKDAIDEEEAREVQQATTALFIQPEDPNYQFLFDKELRKRIESQLEPLDFGQMIFDGFAEQDVTLRKGLVVTYRTLGTRHTLWLERRLHEASRMSEQYGRHWFSLLQISVCVQKINGSSIGTDLAVFDEEEHSEKFWKAVEPRLKKLSKLPMEITDLLIVNLSWFSGRVRKELVGDLTEKVGNS
jgi:hypothetical protein